MSETKNALHKERCLACDGGGVLFDSRNPAAAAWACPVCHGEGWVDPDCNMTLERYDATERQAWDDLRHDNL